MAEQEMSYKVSSVGITDVGLVRHNNEDFWKQLPDLQFYVLADGMGGHQAGEIASKLAVESLCEQFEKNYNVLIKDIDDAKDLLCELVQNVNGIVYLKGQENIDLNGMGTTLCCLFFHPEGVLYAHVGDSRIYRLRNGILDQLTKDHSLMQDLIDQGELSEEHVEFFQYKNVITKAIGTHFYVSASANITNLRPGDIFLMCSDGLTDLVAKGEINQILLQYPEKEAAKALVDLAKSRGGHDNITVMVIHVLNHL